MFEKVTAVRAYERIVEQVESAVYSGELKPGDRLPSERDLMQIFEVSRATVREALRVLQSKGLVLSRAGGPKGPVILPFSTAGLQEALSSLTRAQQLSLEELLQFRLVIEGSINHLAAHGHTDEQLADMDAALEKMGAAVGDDNESFSRADLAFHDAIAVASGNKILQICNQVVRETVLKLVEKKLEHADDRVAQMRDSCRRHALVLDAVRARNGNRAAFLARKHMFEYYSVYMDVDDRDRLALMIDMSVKDDLAEPETSGR